MPLNIDAVRDSNSLIAKLRKVDISVPARAGGRTTDHTETWIAARLLSTLAKAQRLAFPLTVTHRDRPDILIQSGNIEIGVEITEAISEHFAAYSALAEREFPGVFLEPAHFRWDAPRMTVNQMRCLLRQSRLSSDGWAGDRPEQEWALFVQSVVDSKLAKLARSDFLKCDHNWLAVYDNLPLPNIYLERASNSLHALLQNRWCQMPGFDVLFVERGPVVARITADGCEHLRLKDLWE